MSLTTYQSKFVLVGGLHPSTREYTNALLTSSKGRYWKPSLPPMPTKRYDTSSVSTRSPEVLLVVAGGQSSKYKDLNVVEVLCDGDEWITVDPLPAPASGMPSTLHDGKLYFMKCGDQGSTVFTCSCTSLISSFSKSSGSNTSTHAPLWKQIQVPGEWTTAIVSHSSRLVIIDSRGRVKGYSSMTRPWRDATTTGPTPHRYGDTAATVLSARELVFAHRYGGVYRGKVSGEKRLIGRECFLCE